MGYDVYAAARELEAKLDANGLNAWSDRIHDAIAAGVTGTEILMRLDWVLRQFELEATNGDARLSDDVVDLRTQIGRLLGAR